MHSVIEPAKNSIFPFENEYDHPKSDEEDSFMLKMTTKRDDDESPTHNLDDMDINN